MTNVGLLIVMLVFSS